MAPSVRPESITPAFIQRVCTRLVENRPVSRQLPGWGRLHIERQLPFLCVNRQSPKNADVRAARLITSQPSYLLASGQRRLHKELAQLAYRAASTLSRIFGGFLVIEIWTRRETEQVDTEFPDVQPEFKILVRRQERLSSTISILGERLQLIEILKQRAKVDVVSSARIRPQGFPELFSSHQLNDLNCQVLGLEVKPVYRNETFGESYPLVYRMLRRGLFRALEQTAYEFARSSTTHAPSHYYEFGRRALVKAVWTCDRQIADVSSAFDFLLQATPVNSRQAWSDFRRRRFERMPDFIYRPANVSPRFLKRKLFAIPLERVEDPVVGRLLRQKQEQLDRELTMLSDRETARFRYGSLQLYGDVSEEMQREAEQLLDRIPPHSRDGSNVHSLDANQFSRMARDEIAHLREQHPDLDAQVNIRDDVQGLMVSHGNLFVGSGVNIPSFRAEAAIQHEVGTHIATFYNGRAQPFKLLSTGLADYEELQEGLAVVAEYLSGGLRRRRMRLLAARVIAVRMMIEGATFIETFRAIHRRWEFNQHTAFTITMRVYRGGGLTKDAVYMRGLGRLLRHLRNGGRIESLLVGKIGFAHIPIIEELIIRGVLHDVPIRPRYMNSPAAMERLERLRGIESVSELAQRLEKK